jgi:intraflagellar transport protein 88
MDHSKTIFNSELRTRRIFPQGDESHVQALVNQGNCFLQADREDDALDQPAENGFDTDCGEDFYNLAGLFKKRGEYEEASQVFDKFRSISPNSFKAIFEISDCYDKIGLLPQVIESREELPNGLPSNPAIWRRLDGLWERNGNETQAFHCYSESYKYGPSDTEVISSLGGYYRQHQEFENAIHFFLKGLLPLYRMNLNLPY